MENLIDQIRQGDRRCLARAMSLVDDDGPDARALHDHLRRLTGEVPWWGFTGPPGVGKSTLIDALLSLLRKRGERVGVVAVDPTSPTSDGALLGDRIRMMRHAVDAGVFIRSLATHHRAGGLSDAALHCARLLEVAGYERILIETVGVGQNEVDIASVADICVVMLGPGYGDEIQLIKAGLLEIADFVVVNKCDLPEANRLLAELREELGSGSSAVSFDETDAQPGAPSATRKEIIDIQAKSAQGVSELLDKLLAADQTAHTDESRRHHRHRRLLAEIKRGAAQDFERALNQALTSPSGQQLIAELDHGAASLAAVIAALTAAALTEINPGSSPGPSRKAEP